MEVKKFFHMKEGHGDSSYAQNSSLQKKATEMVNHIAMETIQELYQTTTPSTLTLADLGCSSGPNSLSTVRHLYAALSTAWRRKTPTSPPPELIVYLNDLPYNDFNSIFRAHLAQFYEELNESAGERPAVYVAAVPGSFYERLFPKNTLQFVYSSYSLHWLSKVPRGIYNEKGDSKNKGRIYIGRESPKEVKEAYSNQFQDDFNLFLSLRSQELVEGARMVLIFLGRPSPSHFDCGIFVLWELFSLSFHHLISQGKVKEEKLDSYDIHFYAPSREEVEQVVKKEGSFKLDKLNLFEIENQDAFGVAMAVRAIQEPMISTHFGPHILDPLFHTYASFIRQELSMRDIKPATLVLVLTKT